MHIIYNTKQQSLHLPYHLKLTLVHAWNSADPLDVDSLYVTFPVQYHVHLILAAKIS